MRKTLLVSSLAAAAASFGVSATIAQAGGASSPGATPTTTPFDIAAVFEALTPDQMNCLIANSTGIDTSDMGAAVAVLDECGITLADLANVMTPDETATTVAGATETTPATPGATVDQAAVDAVLAMLGFEATDIECLATNLATAVDDTSAVTLLQTCGIDLVELVNSVVAAGMGTSTPADVTASTQAAAATTVAGAVDSGIADMLAQQFETMGVELSEAQIDCLVQQAMSGDSTAMNDPMALLSECDIDITDLMGG